MSKIKNDGLDQYGAEPLEQQQFGTAGVEGVNAESVFIRVILRYIAMFCLFRDILGLFS